MTGILSPVYTAKPICVDGWKCFPGSRASSPSLIRLESLQSDLTTRRTSPGEPGPSLGAISTQKSSEWASQRGGPHNSFQPIIQTGSAIQLGWLQVASLSLRSPGWARWPSQSLNIYLTLDGAAGAVICWRWKGWGEPLHCRGGGAKRSSRCYRRQNDNLTKVVFPPRPNQWGTRLSRPQFLEPFEEVPISFEKWKNKWRGGMCKSLIRARCESGQRLADQLFKRAQRARREENLPHLGEASLDIQWNNRRELRRKWLQREPMVREDTKSKHIYAINWSAGSKNRSWVISSQWKLLHKAKPVAEDTERERERKKVAVALTFLNMTIPSVWMLLAQHHNGLEDKQDNKWSLGCCYKRCQSVKTRGSDSKGPSAGDGRDGRARVQ